MKNLFFIFVCLVAFQANSQEGMQKGTEQRKEDKAPVAAEAPHGMEKVIIYSESCPVEGYIVTLSRDKSTGSGVNTKRYLGVDGIRNTFYASASEVSSLPNFIGLPSSVDTPVIFNGGSLDDYLEVSLIERESGRKYCNQDGLRIPHSSEPLYKVSIGSNNQQWSGLVSIMDGTNLDSADAPFLVMTYNNKRGFTGDERVPEKCLSDCYLATGGGNTDNDGDDKKPWEFMDASGKIHKHLGEENGGNTQEPIKETKKKELKLKKI